MSKQEAKTGTSLGALGATEQAGAFVVGILAVVLGVIGLLRGFGVFEQGTVEQAPLTANFGAGLMWLIPAVAVAILAVTLARADHPHSGEQGASGQMGHTIAYLGAIVTVVLAALAILTGFNWIGQDTTAATGLLWGSASIVSAFVTLAAHMIPPTAVADQDQLVRMVESRVRASGPGPAPSAEPAAKQSPESSGGSQPGG